MFLVTVVDFCCQVKGSVTSGSCCCSETEGVGV